MSDNVLYMYINHVIDNVFIFYSYKVAKFHVLPRVADMSQHVSSVAPLAPASRPTSGGVERINIWRGEVQWREKMRYTDLKVTHTIEAAVSTVRSLAGLPEVNSERWPDRVIMQLLPKTLVSKFGGYYFRNSASVLFQIAESPGFQALTRRMSNGYAGVVHFTGGSDVKILILLYSRDKRAYLGFIPHDQRGFVDRIRTVLRREKYERIEE